MALCMSGCVVLACSELRLSCCVCGLLCPPLASHVDGFDVALLGG